MLLPALSRARDLARAATCMNNLKQCGLASTLYADDNRDFIFLKTYVAGLETIWPAPLKNEGYLPDYKSVLCPSWPKKIYKKYVCYGIRSNSNPVAYYRTINLAAPYYLRYFRRSKPRIPSDYMFISDTVGVNPGAGTTYHNQCYGFSFSAGEGAIHTRHSNAAQIWFLDGHAAPYRDTQIKESALREMPATTLLRIATHEESVIQLNP